MIPDKSYIELIGKGGKVLVRIKIGEGLGGSINEKSDKDFDLAFLAAFSRKDVQDADMNDKAVLMIDYSKPGRSGFTEARMALFRKSSATVFRIDDAAAKRDPSAALRVRYAGGGLGLRETRRRPNSYALTREAAATLLALADRATTPPPDGEPEFRNFDGVKLRVHIEVETKDVFACNVVGFLEGSDPILKKEIVGIGSHLDHLGIRGGEIYNGADDDGSGTTGVLAVARAFTLNNTPTDIMVVK